MKHERRELNELCVCQRLLHNNSNALVDRDIYTYIYSRASAVNDTQRHGSDRDWDAQGLGMAANKSVNCLTNKMIVHDKRNCLMFDDEDVL